MNIPGPIVLVLALALPTLGTAAQISSEGEPMRSVRDGDFMFSFLPKSLQRNPVIDMTVNTEVTNYGRLMRPVSPESPMYYVAAPSGFKQLGAALYGEKSPPVTELERAMKKSLATTGYVESTLPEHPPTLAVIYYWGSHNKLDPETAANFPDLAARYQLERAVLVGGKKYSSNLARALEYGAGPEDRSNDREYLRYQSADDLYFVVASAYDYAALSRGQRKLVWRTTMTANATGVNMKDSIVPLIATAGPYFGKETVDPQIAARKVSREGRVEIGESKVINDPAPEIPASKQP